MSPAGQHQCSHCRSQRPQVISSERIYTVQFLRQNAASKLNSSSEPITIFSILCFLPPTPTFPHTPAPAPRTHLLPLHHHPLRVIIELRVLGPVQQVRTVHWSIVIIFINQSPCLYCSVSQFGPAAKAFGWYANDIGSIPGFGSFVSKINKYIRMCFLTSPRNE